MNVLFLLHAGTNSRDIFRGMIRGFRDAGHTAIVWELAPMLQMINGSDPRSRPPTQAALTRMVKAHIDANEIDLCLCMWANGLLSVTNGTKDGRPASFYEIAGVPLLMWWLDAPHWCQRDALAPLYNTPLLGSDKIISLINIAATADEMRRIMGFANVIDRPYGIDPNLYTPHPGERTSYDIVFAAGPGDPEPTPAMLRELESDDPDTDAIRRDQADRLRPRLAGLVRDPVLADAMIDSQLEDRHRPVLERLEAIETTLDGEPAQALRDLLRAPARFADATMALRTVENWERAFITAYLSQRFGCALMGSGGFPGWPIRAERLGEVPEADMPRVYARSRLALNVMRWQDDAGLNVKPFEITASGAACLCARRSGLGSLWLPGVEIADFEGPHEAVRVARELIADDARRVALAEAGLARTRSEHTWARRSEQLAERLSPLLAGRAGSTPTVQPTVRAGVARAVGL